MLAVLQLVVLAGGGDAADNHHSHLVHVRGVVAAAAEAGVPMERVTVFWADGEDPGPDRAVLRGTDVDGAWMLAGTPLERVTRPEPELVDTRFGYPVLPATRASLSGWLERNGPQLRDGDTLLFAVTDHGQEGPGENPANTSITLWGESWTVEQFAQDLAPVPETVRVVMWMSQCFSGGFATIATERNNTCGAFSADWNRVAYGCFPEFAGRPDVGHFSHLLTGLAQGGVLSAANDAALLSDDVPDTPHLASDEVVLQRMKAEGDEIEAAVAAAPLDARGRRLAAQIAGRFGLGAVEHYGDVLATINELKAVREGLEAWTADRSRVLDQLLGRLTKDPARKIGEPRGSRARRRARRRAVQMVERTVKTRRGLGRRLAALRRADAEAKALFDQIEMQFAAALRVERLYVRIAADALLDAESKRVLEQVRACESKPLWTPPAPPNPRDFVGPPHVRVPLPPVSRLVGAVEALRPGYFGVAYQSAKGGVEISKVVPGSPAAAAGLQRYDIVTAIDGWRLKRDQDMGIVAVTSVPGSVQRWSVKRKGKGRAQNLEVVVAPKPWVPPQESTADAP